MTDAQGGNALIGYTGFVGSTLKRQASFDAYFNRANINSIGNQSYNIAVCAAAPGSMFEANRFPDNDAAAVKALEASLDLLDCKWFVLISTIAVYADFAGLDDENSSAFQIETPYGKHRRALETYCADRFDQCLIVRLPALFGQGLKKNFLFDIMNPVPSMLTADALSTTCDLLPTDLVASFKGLYVMDDSLGLYMINRAQLDTMPERPAINQALLDAGRSALGFTNPQSCFQFYPMDRLWRDIEIALVNELDSVNLATPPLCAGDIYKAACGHQMPANQARLHKEDMRTLHGQHWGADEGYVAARADIESQVQAFLTTGRGDQ